MSSSPSHHGLPVLLVDQTGLSEAEYCAHVHTAWCTLHVSLDMNDAWPELYLNFWPWLELGWVTVGLKWMLYVINTVLYMLTSPTKTHLIVKSQNTVKEYDIKVF